MLTDSISSLFQGFLLLLAASQLAQLVKLCVSSADLLTLRTIWTVAACVLEFASTLALLLRYWNRPNRSHILELALLVSAVLGGIKVHTIWARDDGETRTAAATEILILRAVTTGLYAIFLIVLSWPPRRPVNPDKRGSLLSDEAEASLLSLLSMAWLNPLLAHGQKASITLGQISDVDVHPATVFHPLPGTPSASPTGTSRSLAAQMLRDIPVRTQLTYVLSLILGLLTTAATLGQPLVIRGLVDFLQGEQHRSVGVWLVLALILEYACSLFPDW